ncbi:MAG: 4-hydroxybutyrate CoA-transferase [Crocinitomicaceae bacterium]|nr:4-hydroxybutyrate CoA-transferase [Crocinitomicaceae bacterium]MCF8434521.1 4-hydroxybutyrate CoA-transferase [Crocinitomicaceae bacterium]
MITTPEEAVKCIQSNDHVFIHSAAAAPQSLVNAMSNRYQELKNVSIYSLHTEGNAPYAQAEMADAFHLKPFFVGQNIRENIQSNRGSYIPVFLSEVPSLFRSGIIQLDVALISVSPPDLHGYCSLGTSVDISLAAVQSAKIIIAQLNEHVPRTHGDGFLHISKINYVIEENTFLPGIYDPTISAVELAIGKNIAELVEDGATLQMGIGSIPNAVLSCLENHKNLGIHSEMFSDGILPLVEKGIITGSKKSKYRNSIIGSFAVGSQKLYDFMHDNPMVKMLDFAYVNSVEVIRKNQKVTAINSAIEIDLTGQICADSIGSKIFSGVGGQMDFIRGASLSEGGKPIIALPSTTKRGDSKIVVSLKKGAGVVTTRAHVHWVVTEYGAVNLHGKSIHERAKLLIGIAHPAHRESLEKEFYSLTNN